ncbi:MAG: YhdH/YhfP family quinone oxidoreductase [Candidatus Kapabacteria bacterium]|nr:YhdH/YhfP family quinone oxidoreductase [Candidatus Kapabacteria bacterium]
MKDKFRALVVREADGKFLKQIEMIDEIGLRYYGDKEVTETIIEVEYSGLNYKDALSASGNKGITKQYPHIPGIDLAGKIVATQSSKFKIGDEVIVTGYDMGMNHYGGFCEYATSPDKWIVPRPQSLTLKEAMIYGTSGFTAALGVLNIVEHGITPESGKILVTGATGAVGSMAVSILSKLGYEVAASTGKESEADYLKSLGANEIIDRKTLVDDPQKGLFSSRWAAAFDTVGGPSLSYILKCIAPSGIVTNCGMITSTKLETSIMPFIIRGVKLSGIAASATLMPKRLKVWEKIAGEYNIHPGEDFYDVVSLEELPEKIDLMLAGKLHRKVVVKL